MRFAIVWTIAAVTVLVEIPFTWWLLKPREKKKPELRPAEVILVPAGREIMSRSLNGPDRSVKPSQKISNHDDGNR